MYQVYSQEKNVTLWFSENGQRVGTYVGHNGQVSTCDVTSESQPDRSLTSATLLPTLVA